jgi:hypothetical protein
VSGRVVETGSVFLTYLGGVEMAKTMAKKAAKKPAKKKSAAKKKATAKKR